jgi:hypothetical protein
MKKIFIIVIILTSICSLNCQNINQYHYVSELFDCTVSIDIQADLDTKPYNNIYATTDSVLFVINQQGFNSLKMEGFAKISKINLFSGSEQTYLISPSPKYLENRGILRQLWIWAIAVSNSLLFVAIDEEIWVYCNTSLNQYEYLKTISIAHVSDMEIVNNVLHVFVENNEGYDWLKVNLENNEIENVRKLVLHNHFFLQIAPAKMIAINNNTLYFLQRNEPAIEKYSLSGNLLSKYSLEMPNWRKIPNNLTRQLDSIDDITERNYAFATFSIFENNFVHLFYVFPCERFFIIAIDKNLNNETYITPYFVQIIGDSTMVEPYSVKLNENEKFRDAIFPFLTASAGGNVVFAQSQEYVIQINNNANVEWFNKTQKEFQHDVNLYFRDNDPNEKIETYHFKKNMIPVDSIQFLNYDDNKFTLNDIKKDKAIIIISQYPQCATCIKMMWHYFSNKIMPNVELLNVAPDCPTYLSKKENIKEVNNYLKTEYTPLFINTKKLNPATKQILSQKANPIVLLFDKKLQHIEVISATNIMGDIMGNLSTSFLHSIDNFVEN